MREPARSAVPLAATGIICLGLVPTLGGPESPLHWTMTAGMVGFGVLLHVRRRLRPAEGSLREVSSAVARRAGRSMLITVAIIALLIGVLLAWRFDRHASMAPFSVALPVAALAWLSAIGLRVLRHGTTVAEAEQPSVTDRPSHVGV